MVIDRSNEILTSGLKLTSLPHGPRKIKDGSRRGGICWSVVFLKCLLHKVMLLATRVSTWLYISMFFWGGKVKASHELLRGRVWDPGPGEGRGFGTVWMINLMINDHYVDVLYIGFHQHQIGMLTLHSWWRTPRRNRSSFFVWQHFRAKAGGGIRAVGYRVNWWISHRFRSNGVKIGETHWLWLSVKTVFINL